MALMDTEELKEQVEEVKAEGDAVEAEAKELEAETAEAEQNLKEIEDRLKSILPGAQGTNSQLNSDDLSSKLAGLAVDHPAETGSPMELRDEPDDEPKEVVDLSKLGEIQPPCNTRMSDEEEGEDEIKFEDNAVNIEGVKE